MHELSIIANLFKILEEKAVEKNAVRITGVHLKVGILSGAVPELLQTSFDMYKKDTIASLAALHAETVPLRTECEDCGAVTTKDDFVFLCDRCGSSRLKTLSGTELLLEKIDMEVE